MRSHSQIRSAAPRSDGTLPAKTGRQVVAAWPVEPRFHSMPPANQALVSAKLANCRRRLVNTRSVGQLVTQRPEPAPQARKHERLQPTVGQLDGADLPRSQVAAVSVLQRVRQRIGQLAVRDALAHVGWQVGRRRGIREASAAQ